MSEDRRRPRQYASLRDASLGPWLRDVVFPTSAPLRQAMSSAGLGPRGVRTAADLARLPVVPVTALGDGRDWVLTPTQASVHAHGDLATRARLVVAGMLGREAEFTRAHLDPQYKPVAWSAVVLRGRPLLTAAAHPDLERLAELGRRGLSISGVRADDRVLVVGTPAGVGQQQLAEGCRDAGVASLQLPAGGSPDLVAAVGPTVVSTGPRLLRRLVDHGMPDTVRLLIAHATTAAQVAAALVEGQRVGIPLSVWWAPPGTRAAWVSCPGGTGLHTWPTHELVEVLDDDARPVPTGTTGSLVWSAVGWRGSVWLRVALGATAAVDDRTCPACHRTTPRVVPELPGAVAA